MPDYEKPTPAELALLDGLIRMYHTRLTEVGVTVGMVFASPDPEKEGTVLKLHGYTCAAIARKTTQNERRYGGPDCEIEFDRWTWERLSEGNRAALVDHELTHFVAVKDKDGMQKLDRRLRPVVAIRNHDFQIGGFDEVVDRHGDAAIESMSVRRIQQRNKQLRFTFTSEDEFTPYDEFGEVPEPALTLSA